MVTFTSTAIDVTDENIGLITGDLTLNGITKSVVLDATLNPMAGLPWVGFDWGEFAPSVGDDVAINISIEADVPAE